jgi:hypothetical protein
VNAAANVRAGPVSSEMRAAVTVSRYWLRGSAPPGSWASTFSGARAARRSLRAARSCFPVRWVEGGERVAEPGHDRVGDEGVGQTARSVVDSARHRPAPGDQLGYPARGGAELQTGVQVVTPPRDPIGNLEGGPWGSGC